MRIVHVVESIVYGSTKVEFALCVIFKNGNVGELR